ncbi:hypothetical protein [Cellulomonas fengjieae]|uniref:hypothetical protein n=1 Tax=Cellulomonas fengjieae TaxID=2819978 RepID=UPI001AAE5E4F|nr:hypothetical protein [Cellulomonas fengjieae]MBO3102568.1 hypothetical protein [Cellulomonas fengjieae]
MALLLTLTGCGGSEVAADGGTGSKVDQASVLDPSTSNDGLDVMAWGQTMTYADGLALTVSQPTGYTPGEWAAGTEGHTNFVTFDVTVMNGTSQPYDPLLLMTGATSGGVAASEVFDSEVLGTRPDAAILPGQTVTWKVGYGVADPADITVDVSAGLDENFNSYDDVFWQGPAA